MLKVQGPALGFGYMTVSIVIIGGQRSAFLKWIRLENLQRGVRTEKRVLYRFGMNVHGNVIEQRFLVSYVHSLEGVNELYMLSEVALVILLPKKRLLFSYVDSVIYMHISFGSQVCIKASKEQHILCFCGSVQVLIAFCLYQHSYTINNNTTQWETCTIPKQPKAPVLVIYYLLYIHTYSQNIQLDALVTMGRHRHRLKEEGEAKRGKPLNNS